MSAAYDKVMSPKDHRKKENIMKNRIHLATLILLFSGTIVNADNNQGKAQNQNAHGSSSPMLVGFKLRDVAPVEHPLYKEKCGSCHFAYQPGLLPARSWKKIMAGVQNHFNENININSEDQKKITEYLIKNSADHSKYNRSRRIAKSLDKGDVPTQITKISYFIKKHIEVAKLLKKEKMKSLSLSHCKKCHTEAENGSYNKKTINLPQVIQDK